MKAMAALAQLDRVIAGFYPICDNRGARPVQADAIRRMFIPQAVIVRAQAGKLEVLDLAAFVEPRVAMLTDGTLREFHEWETAAQTHINGAMASRRSEYEKHGLLRGGRYAGGGTKMFQIARHSGTWKFVSVLWEDSQ